MMDKIDGVMVALGILLPWESGWHIVGHICITMTIIKDNKNLLTMFRMLMGYEFNRVGT
jgi:hypothetical protein